METKIFTCELCNYQSAVKCNYNKHLKTKMHMEKSQIQAQTQSTANTEISLLKSQVETLQNKVNILEEQNKNIINMFACVRAQMQAFNNCFNKNEVNNNDDIVLYEGEKVSIDDIIINSENEERKIDDIIEKKDDENKSDEGDEDGKITDEIYTDTDMKEGEVQNIQNASFEILMEQFNEDEGEDDEDDEEISPHQHDTDIPSYFKLDLHIPTEEEIELKIKKQKKEREEREKKILEEVKEKEKQISEYEKKRVKQIKETMRKWEKGEPLFGD